MFFRFRDREDAARQLGQDLSGSRRGCDRRGGRRGHGDAQRERPMQRRGRGGRPARGEEPAESPAMRSGRRSAVLGNIRYPVPNDQSGSVYDIREPLRTWLPG